MTTTLDREAGRAHSAYHKPAIRRRAVAVELRLRLDAAIYTKPALQRAAAAFAGLARVRIRRDGADQEITFDAVARSQADRLADEFANYALGCLVVEP